MSRLAARAARPAAAVVAGLCVPLALAPFDLWPLAVLAPALLLVALRGCPPSAAAWRGWLFGLAKYGLGISWVYVSIHEYGGAPPALAGFLVALFVLGLAVFPALLALAFAWLTRGRDLLAAALALAGMWVLLEWLRTWVLTGFPWLFSGYAHLDTALAGFGPVAGVLGVSLLCVLSGVLAVYVIVAAGKRRGRAAAGGVAVIAAIWLLGAILERVHWVRPSGGLSVALVQGNVPQEIKWRQESRSMIVERYLGLTEPYWGSELIVWPEAALTIFRHRAKALLERLDARAEGAGTTLVTGIPARVRRTGKRGDALQNTAIALGDGEGQYAKHRLVPFGEYVPLESWLRGLIDFFDLPMSHAAPGPVRQPGLRADGRKLALAICYEVAYPGLVRGMAQHADLLVTISNDTWFGDSIGPHQHMQMARMRALEHGRGLLRATNDGITGIVGPRGRLHARLPRFEQGVLPGEVGLYTGRTPFNRFGSAPALALAVMLLFPAAWGRWRAGRPRGRATF